MKKILFLTGFLFSFGLFAQDVNYFDLNPGGTAARLKTQKFKIDQIWDVAQVKDAKDNPLPLYECWVRLANDPAARGETYHHVFILADSSHFLAQMLRDNKQILEQTMWVEFYLPNEVNIEEVMVTQYMKMLSKRGEDSKEAKKLFRKEIDAMTDKYYICVKAFIPENKKDQVLEESIPRVNISDKDSYKDF